MMAKKSQPVNLKPPALPAISIQCFPVCIDYKHSQDIEIFKEWNKVIYIIKDTQKDNFR